MQDRKPIHVAAKFDKDKTDKYDKAKMREYIRTMLEDGDILYSNTLAVENKNRKMTVQIKLMKAAVHKDSLNKVIEVLEALDGHLDTWILSESVMHHPEIIK